MVKALPLIVTLLAGTVGGVVLDFLGAPAAFLVGSAVGVTLAVVVRLPTHLPMELREPAFAILGIMMGAGVHPEALGTLAKMPLALVGLALAVMGATAASYFVLSRVAKWDRVTALCSSIPGALQVTMAVAVESGSRVERVAIAQALRLFILVSLVPLVFGGNNPLPLGAFSAAEPDPVTVALTIAIGIGSGYFGKFFKIPAAMMVVPLCVGAVISASGLLPLAVPSVVAAAAFIILGASVAVRFEGMKGSDVLPTLRTSLGSFVAAFAVAISVAAIFSGVLGESLGAVFLAFSPGGADVMIALAFLLNLDVTFVAMLHVARLIALSVGAPILVALVRRGAADEASERAHSPKS
ncbi:MAG: AbrB family transcriptional regulator [Pseudomonadota bacterium]